MTHIAETFRALHVPGRPFILANVWDAGTAKMLQSLGAQALATSSAAHAYVLGRPDGGTLTRDEALSHAEDIVRATNLPVQGDFENGFGDDPETCAETVRLAAEVGLAGICIEDTALPAQTPYDAKLSVERIRAAAAAAKALPHDFVLTARADGIMTGGYDIDEAIARCTAFADAGADAVYAPLPNSMDDLAKLCAAVPVPVNALVAGRYTAQTLAEFADAGVARLSLGSALARTVHKTIYDAATEMFEKGTFTRLGKGISGDIVDGLLQKE
ncbi:isocitrate lyase/PEP mutase family protein [Yoonia sp. 208BN28-4]|uniref:isocitrate lyase/PEP mutase family protein n=1 Tax=Yoonia sp. 208BN28-4 TaxID=3126505 RepID=UPI00309A2F60